MNDTTCTGCWQYAITKAARTNGDVASWYSYIHDECHQQQKLPVLRVNGAR